MSRGPIQEVVACSTGNHGAAVALAAKQFDVKARIFLAGELQSCEARTHCVFWCGDCRE